MHLTITDSLRMMDMCFCLVVEQASTIRCPWHFPFELKDPHKFHSIVLNNKLLYHDKVHVSKENVHINNYIKKDLNIYELENFLKT